MFECTPDGPRWGSSSGVHSRLSARSGFEAFEVDGFPCLTVSFTEAELAAKPVLG